LLLGKGHEQGQEINGVITPFNDAIELSKAIRKAVKP
jgi:UDP-N-acetylmuramoyl-L-alanyl-D-glutamate--2,6-diaminopimelate ligase